MRTALACAIEISIRTPRCGHVSVYWCTPRETLPSSAAVAQRSRVLFPRHFGEEGSQTLTGNLTACRVSISSAEFLAAVGGSCKGALNESNTVRTFRRASRCSCILLRHGNLNGDWFCKNTGMSTFSKSELASTGSRQYVRRVSTRCSLGRYWMSALPSRIGCTARAPLVVRAASSGCEGFG